MPMTVHRLLYCVLQNIIVSLCMGGSKGKAGIQLKCIPEKRDIIARKVMHIISGINL